MLKFSKEADSVRVAFVPSAELNRFSENTSLMDVLARNVVTIYRDEFELFERLTALNAKLMMTGTTDEQMMDLLVCKLMDKITLDERRNPKEKLLCKELVARIRWPLCVFG